MFTLKVIIGHISNDRVPKIEKQEDNVVYNNLVNSLKKVEINGTNV